MEQVLLCQDLLLCVFPNLHKRQAAVAAATCRAWHTAISSLSAEPGAFRPRILVGCARNCQLVDVSHLVEPSAIPDDDLPRTKETVRRRARNAEPFWVTSIAFSPYGRRDLYVCQYHAWGIIRYCGTSLKSQGTVVHHIMLKEPEGVCFAHGYMYVQNNWGQVIRCSLEGEVLDRTYVGGELVTWAVVPGPDGHLYISADHQYSSTLYTDVPEETTGCILRAQLRTDGSFISEPPTPYTRTQMKRPCGLRWGARCGTLFVTCLDPAVLRFAGPSHATPGVLLSRITLDSCPGLMPWDVVVVRGTYLVISMHKHRSLRAPRQHRHLTRAKPARQQNTQDHQPSRSTPEVTTPGLSSSSGMTVDKQDEEEAGSSAGGVQQQQKVVSAQMLANMLLDECRGCLYVIPDLGEGVPRVVPLPKWMDHANMMCVEE